MKKRIYTMLFDGRKWTNKDKLYSRVTRNVMQVCAVSIKQAYYLANTDTWYESVGDVGIVATRDVDRSPEWYIAIYQDRRHNTPYKHGYLSHKREEEIADCETGLKGKETND